MANRPDNTYVSQVFNFGVDKSLPLGFVNVVYSKETGNVVGYEKGGKFYNVGEKIPEKVTEPQKRKTYTGSIEERVTAIEREAEEARAAKAESDARSATSGDQRARAAQGDVLDNYATSLKPRLGELGFQIEAYARKIARGDKLSTIEEKELKRFSDEYAKLNKTYNEARSDAAELAEFMDQAQRKLEDGIVDSIVEGKKFTDVLGDMAKMFAKAALEASLFGKGPLSGSFGTSGSGGLLGGLLDGVFGAIGGSASMVSFDGGGYTGSGLRTGGLDGKGGFPAVLHPNETVLDHTRGGSRQGGGGTFAPQTSIVIQGNADERTLSMMRSELDKRDRAFFANWQKANKEYNARIS